MPQTKSALIVLPTAILGGAERVMFNLALFLIDQGFNVTVYIMSRGNQPGWEEIESHSNFRFVVKDFKSEKSSLPFFFYSLFKMSRKNNFDYIFSTHTHVNAALSMLRNLSVVRCGSMVSRESTFIFERFYGLRRFFFKALYRYMYGAQDLLVCQTEAMKQSLISNLGFSPCKNVSVIPNPVNLKNIRNLMSDNISLDRDRKVIVACGRLVKIKRFDLIVDAFSSAALNKAAKLLIIGDGPELLGLESQVIALGLTEDVLFLGRQANPIKWFVHADIGVISSDKEGFPNVLLEMMAAGIPQIISTRCTDGVLSIPSIALVRTDSILDMAECLKNAVLSNVSNASIYQRYILDHRDIASFWDSVKRESSSRV